MKSTTVLSMAAGALAGALATGPMTLLMVLWYRYLPPQERYPLPPREITEKLAEEAGIAPALDEATETTATMIAHFGYGAAAGSLYAISVDKVNLPALSKGISFGLLVWLVSYLGLLPAAGILKPATEHPARRNLLMIVAHVVWGATLGSLVKK